MSQDKTEEHPLFVRNYRRTRKEVNEMNTMPRFTAEWALCSHHDRYVTRICTASNQHVIAQKINDKCWIDRFERTYFRCVSIGYDLDPCMEVAAGLADSVCDF